jgi:hypothetical protein
MISFIGEKTTRLIALAADLFMKLRLNNPDYG